ncbi:MAG TPA: hypothetical protein VGQ38_06620 [Gaiellaceae bacterium]|jgi:hypothetical protein|nr:hypothetical protein [Gaiellaceae bacterium]
MWIIRELIRLLEKIAIAIVIALILALIQVPFRDNGGVVAGFQLSCIIVGAFLLLMAGVGSDSNFARRMDYGVTESALGRIPGVSTLNRTGEDPHLSAGAVFVGSGIVLLAIGFLV